MSHFTGIIVINKPTALCFDYITAPAYWPTYHPDSIRVKQEEGGDVDLFDPLQKGTKCIEVTKVGFFQLPLHWETTEYDRPNLFQISGYAAGGAKLQITYEFSEICEGTTSFRRTFIYSYKPLIMKILNFFYLRHIAYEDGAAALPGAKRELESMSCNVSRYERQRAKAS